MPSSLLPCLEGSTVPETSPAFTIILILEYSIVVFYCCYYYYLSISLIFIVISLSQYMGRLKVEFIHIFIQRTNCTHCNKNVKNNKT